MPMDTDFAADCTSTINVAALTDAGATNTPTHGTPVAVTAYVKQETKRMLQADGTMRVSSHKVIIPVSSTLSSLNDAAWLWLPDDSVATPGAGSPPDATARTILELREAKDPETLVLSHWIVRV